MRLVPSPVFSDKSSPVSPREIQPPSPLPPLPNYIPLSLSFLIVCSFFLKSIFPLYRLYISPTGPHNTTLSVNSLSLSLSVSPSKNILFSFARDFLLHRAKICVNKIFEDFFLNCEKWIHSVLRLKIHEN